MSAEKSPVVSKLILLVLVLILACLVILIAKQNAIRKAGASSTLVQSVTEEISPAEQVEPPPSLPFSNRPAARKPVGNLPLPVAAPAPQNLAANPPEVTHPPAAHPSVAPSLVNLPPRRGSDAAISSVGSAEADGNVAGYVWLTGTPPPETEIRLDSACGRLHTNRLTTRRYLTTQDGRLADVFIYVKSGLPRRRFVVPTNAVVMDNISCLFEPAVAGAQVGQRVQFRNSDPLMHNVHALPRINREFNLALAGKDQAFEKTFDRPEVLVRVKCDVHPWMFAYIGVVAHPFFAVTDGEGMYRLPATLPEGDYTIAAHHPKAGEVSQQITVRAGESLRLDFTLAVPSGP